MSADGRTAAGAAAGSLADSSSVPIAASIAVVVALGVERRSLDKRRSAGAAFGILQSGPGPERAARAATAALASGARALVSWGFAGGLAPELVPGAVLLPRRVREAAGPAFDVDPSWHAALERALAADFAPCVADLVSVTAPLTTPASKSHAAATAAAVDMESAAIAAVAARARAPFVVLRVVVDAANDSLPDDAERWIDERGERRLAPALGAALAPGRWRELFTLAQRYRAASRALEALAATVAATGFCVPGRA